MTNTKDVNYLAMLNTYVYIVRDITFFQGYYFLVVVSTLKT